MYTHHNLMFMQFNSSSIDFGCFTPRTNKYRLEFVAPGVGTGLASWFIGSGFSVGGATLVSLLGNHFAYSPHRN